MKSSKFIILVSFILLAFAAGDSKSTYHVPRNPGTISSCDIDLDGDVDIIIGHYYSFSTEWSGISFMQNDNTGLFYLKDSLYIYTSQDIIYCVNIKGDEFPEVLGRYYDGQQSNVAIIETINGNYITTYYPLCNNMTKFNIGDLTGNNIFDIVFISNNDFLWGIIYNDGIGNFSLPEIHDMDYPPLDIACADLNGDESDDVVVSSSVTEIYFSNDSGFQQQYLGDTWTTGCDLILTDFDHDGLTDILVSGGVWGPHTRVYMFKNAGENQFIQQPSFEFETSSSYSQATDFNNDSLPEMVFISSNCTLLNIYKNKEEFQLEFDQSISIDNMSPKGLSCSDFDDNGFVDIVVSFGIGQPEHFIKILFNDGTGVFQEDPITRTDNPKSKLQNSIMNIYPNPYDKNTTIEIDIIQNDYIKLDVYDLKGNLVKKLNNKALQSGKYEFIWNGEDEKRKEVNNGLYLIRLQSGGKVYTQRVVRLK
jgi:hypothetical protein